MSFKTLTESQIVANLIDSYTSLVSTSDDMNRGSVLRSTFEAFAMELRRLYQNIQENADEVQKTAAYTMFQFPLLPASAAYTMETINVSPAPVSAVNIPAGTTFQVNGTTIQYKTPVAMSFPAGQTSYSVRVVCTQVGSVGNKPANTITQLVTPISGLNVVSVANSQDVRTGSDLETSDQRANRFQQWINSLHAGDIGALKYGAKTASIIDAYGYVSEAVTKAQLVEGSGSNTIYVDNGYYNISDQLIQQCQQVINGYVDTNGNFVRGYKAAGVPTTIVRCTVDQQIISVLVAPRNGYTFPMIQQSVISSIVDLVQSLDVGQTLAVNDLNLAIGRTPGVLNFSHSIVADVVPAAGHLIQLGLGQPIVNPM